MLIFVVGEDNDYNSCSTFHILNIVKDNNNNSHPLQYSKKTKTTVSRVLHTLLSMKYVLKHIAQACSRLLSNIIGESAMIRMQSDK